MIEQPYVCKDKNIITIYQGSTYNDTLTITQPDGLPVDLTGAIVRSQLKTLAGNLACIFDCQISEPTLGIIQRSIVADSSATIVPYVDVQHVWGVEVTLADGSVLPEIQGGALVIAEIVQ